MDSPHPPPERAFPRPGLPHPGGPTTKHPEQPTAQAFIRYDPQRTDYTLTEGELRDLTNGATSLWKDLCLVSVSLGVPALLNAAVGVVSEPAATGATLFLNALVGAVGLLLGAGFGAAWRAEAAGRRALVAAIRGKPRVAVAITRPPTRGGRDGGG